MASITVHRLLRPYRHRASTSSANDGNSPRASPMTARAGRRGAARGGGGGGMTRGRLGQSRPGVRVAVRGSDATARLARLLEPLARTVPDSGILPGANPVGLTGGAWGSPG